MAGRQESGQAGSNILCVHCDAFSLIATDDAQEANVPVLGFLQTTYSMTS